MCQCGFYRGFHNRHRKHIRLIISFIAQKYDWHASGTQVLKIVTQVARS